MPSIDSLDLVLQPEDNQRLSNLCGHLDGHLRLIEQRLSLSLSNRGAVFRIEGNADRLSVAAELLKDLYVETGDAVLTEEQVHLALQETQLNDREQGAEREAVVRTRRSQIRARGHNQVEYIEGMRACDLAFGVGPAGTGKTYLAVACAVEALESDAVRRIILVRPAVEAGERLGFLPGDLAQKVDPYLRPMYDALYEMLGFEKVAKLMERNVIEVAPLAYMRGRTLNEAFIVMDEAQNTTVEQMKMFLTRIGFGSTAVVTGDMSQTDLPNKSQSGLRHTLKVLEGVKGIHETHFQSCDVVRHPMVKRIVDAYDAYEANQL